MKGAREKKESINANDDRWIILPLVWEEFFLVLNIQEKKSQD